MPPQRQQPQQGGGGGAGQYIPPSPDPAGYVLEKMSGMNTSVTRPAVADEQTFVMDGFIPLDDQNARTLPGIGLPLFASLAPTIIKFDFFVINAVPYAALFMSDGSVQGVNTGSGALFPIAPAGTISGSTIGTIGSRSYGGQYFLFVSFNGYWIWDGATLFVPGAAWPPGGIIPVGIQGFAIEVYSGRIWIIDGATVFYSAPGSLVDFSSAAGGGNFISSDSFLVFQFIQAVSVNGFLYLIADSSINYISGVNTAGAPPVTTFTNQNADAQVGSPYSASVEAFGRNILFVNSFGIHVIYGSDVKKVSKPLDGIFSSTGSDFNGFHPSVGQAVVFGRRIWCILNRLVDPITNLTRNKIYIWDGDKKFSLTEQDNINDLTFIKHQEFNSTIKLWGTNGTQFFPVLQSPSSSFTKRILSKLWAKPGNYMTEKTPGMLWAAFQYPSMPPIKATSVTIDTETGIANGQTYTFPLSPSGGFYVPPPIAVTQTGAMIGMLVETDDADTVVMSVGLSTEITQYRG